MSAGIPHEYRHPCHLHACRISDFSIGPTSRQRSGYGKHYRNFARKSYDLRASVNGMPHSQVPLKADTIAEALSL